MLAEHLVQRRGARLGLSDDEEVRYPPASRGLRPRLLRGAHGRRDFTNGPEPPWGLTARRRSRRGSRRAHASARWRPLTQSAMAPADALLRRLRRLRSRASGGPRVPAPGDVKLDSDISFDPQAPAVVLSPHWDDAVLGCWSALAADTELTVVNVFGGLPDAGVRGTWELVAGFPDSRARALARLEEDAGALALAGRTPANLS